jgi:MFS family permease
MQEAAMPEPPIDARRNVLLLGAVSFINDTASKIIIPLLPLFIAQQGGTGLAIGLIAGFSESIASLTKLIAGHWSDRLQRRKPFVFGGYLLSSLAKLLLAFSVSWPQTLALRVAERLGKGARSAPRDALLAAATKKNNRGRGFGLHRAMDSGGALFGTLLVLALYWFLDLGFQTIFLIAGMISFASLLPLFWVREQRSNKRLAIPLHWRRLPPTLKRFLGIAFVYALANFSYMFFILRAEGAFDGRLAVAIPLLLYALYQLSFTLFAFPAGVLSDRIGRRRVLLAGYGLFTLLCLGFIFAGTLLPLLGLFLLYGLNYALVEATERALVADLAPETERGTALGAYHMATSLAALPAGLLAGLLWDLNPLYTFSAGALLSLTASAMLLRVPASARPHGSAG